MVGKYLKGCLVQHLHFRDKETGQRGVTPWPASPGPSPQHVLTGEPLPLGPVTAQVIQKGADPE